MKYLFEKDVGMPLCAVKDKYYIDLLTGEVITNPNKLEFIEKYIKNKSIYENDARVEIIAIKTKTSRKLIGYAYIIDDISYFLNEEFNLLTNEETQFVNKQLCDDKYVLESIWK